jgi:hypothetical protein
MKNMVSVRLPHTLEILADEFVYAGMLVALLVRYPNGRGTNGQSKRAAVWTWKDRPLGVHCDQD